MNYSDLFFVCSVIEFIGRERRLARSIVVSSMGKSNIERLYQYADVFHCEPIAKVADDFIIDCKIPVGNFDNVASCKYDIPSYWDIGHVYARLIEDVNTNGNDVISTLIEVFNSPLCQLLSNFNSDLYYQPREYLRECYLAGDIIDY